MYSGVMEGGGEEVAAWLTSPAFESRLFTCFPCTNIIPSAANQVTPSSTSCSCLVLLGLLFFCSVNSWLVLLGLLFFLQCESTVCYMHQHHPPCCQPGSASSSFCSGCFLLTSRVGALQVHCCTGIASLLFLQALHSCLPSTHFRVLLIRLEPSSMMLCCKHMHRR